MKTLLLVLIPVSLLAQSARTVSPPLLAANTVNLYIATGGSDSNPCTSASKCLTLAHIRKLIPQTLDANYVINVADGTYAEALDMGGFIGSGLYVGTQTTSIKILGNTTTPANVIFSGTAVCANLQLSFHSVGCFVGSAKIALYGLTISSALETGVGCFGGTVEYNKVVVTMTGGPTQNSRGLNNIQCTYTISGNLTISGFDTNAGGSGASGGFGIYDSLGTLAIQTAGTLTITGPGTGGDPSADGTHGYICETGCVGFIGIGGAIVISGVQTGILVSDTGNFRTLASNLTISNGSTTPTSSNGFEVDSVSSIAITSTGTVTIDHYTNCLDINYNSMFAAGIGNHTLTNCVSSVTSFGGQVRLF